MMKNKNYITFEIFYHKMLDLARVRYGSIPDEWKVFYLLSSRHDNTLIIPMEKRAAIWREGLSDNQLEEIAENYYNLTRDEYLELWTILGEKDFAEFKLGPTTKPIRIGERIALITRIVSASGESNLYQKYSKILKGIKQPEINRYYSGKFTITSSGLIDVDSGVLQTYAVRIDKLEKYVNISSCLIFEKFAEKSDIFTLTTPKSNTFDYDFSGETFAVDKVGFFIKDPQETLKTFIDAGKTNSFRDALERYSEKELEDDMNEAFVLATGRESKTKQPLAINSLHAYERKILNEGVIDAKSRFAKRRRDNIVDTVKGAFQRQDSQEKFVKERYESIVNGVDKMFSVARMKMAMPITLRDWDPDLISFFKILSLYNDYDESDEEVKQFVLNNADAVRESVDFLTNEIAQFEKDADELSWPAPWRRYTNWGSFIQDVHHFKENASKILNSYLKLWINL